MNVTGTSGGRILGLGLDTFGVGRTPVAILLVVLVLTAIAVVFFGGLSQVGAKLVDRRWPADEPLTPAELLWGETGSYVGKTFPGLDPIIAHDLSQYITSKKVKPGEVIIEAGDLPTEFVLVKSGDVEVLDPRQPAPVAAKAGASFGSEAILRRQPHAFTVKAKNPVEVLTLSAEDYLAGLALGAQRGEDRFVLDQLSTYLAEPGLGMQGPPRAKPADVTPTPMPTSQPQPASPQQASPEQGVAQPHQSQPAPQLAASVLQQWPAATHQVAVANTPGFPQAAGRVPSRMLPAGLPIAAYEQLPGWLHVRSIDGWDGWVAETNLIRLR